MGKIATWSFLNSKFGTSGSPTNKCPRKSDIEATGKVKVSGSYSSNQLVQEADCASAKKNNYIDWMISNPGQFGTFIRYDCDYVLATTINVSGAAVIKINNTNFRDEPYSFSLSSGLAVFTDTVPNATAFRNMSITPTSDSSYNYSIKTM